MLISILMRYAINRHNCPANTSTISELSSNEASLYHIFCMLFEYFGWYTTYLNTLFVFSLLTNSSTFFLFFSAAMSQ